MRKAMHTIATKVLSFLVILNIAFKMSQHNCYTMDEMPIFFAYMIIILFCIFIIAGDFKEICNND